MAALFAIAGAAITALSMIAPAIVRDRAIAELRASGFASPSLRVRHVGPTEIRLADVRLGPDLVIDEVDVGIDPLARRVTSLTLIGARFTVEPTAEALEASTPARILRQSPGASDEGAPDRVRLSRGEVVIGGTSIGVEGDVFTHRGRARLKLTSPLGTHDVAVRVTPGRGETQIALRAESARDRLDARVRLADARVDVRATARLGEGERAMGEHRAELASAVVHARASIVGARRIERLALRASAESVSLDDVALGALSLDASREGDAIAWRAKAEKPGELRASLAGALPVEIAEIGVPRAMDWQIEGTIPASLMKLPGAEISGVGVRLSGRADVEGDRVALDEVRGTIRVASLRAPSASLDLADVDAEVSGRGAIGERVDLELDPSSRVRAERASIADLHASGLAFAPHVRIAAGAHGVRVRALDTLRPSMDLLAIGTGPAALRFERVRATIAERDALLADVRARDARIAFHIEATAPRVAGVLQGRGVRARGDLDASLVPGDERIGLPITATVAHLCEPESETSLDASRVAIPLFWHNGELRSHGRMRGAAAWRGVPIGETSGAIDLATDRIALAWKGPATRTSQFELTVGVRLGAEPSGSVDVVLPRAVANEDDPISRVLAELTTLRIAGSVEGDLHVPIEAPARGRARLTLEHGDIAKADGGGSAHGVRGTLRITHLTPVESAPARVAWSALSVGDAVDAGAGSAELRLEAPSHIAIRDMRAELAGGRVRLAPFRFDWEAPELALEMTLSGVELERVLAVTKGRIVGRGRLDGRLALRVKLGEDRRIVLGDGRLTARGPGRLRIDDLAKVAPPSKNDLDAVMDGQLIQQRVLNALSDFRYRQLVLTVDEERGTRRVRARVVGRGARTPQELDVTLNLRGIQPLLDRALRLWPSGETTIEVRQHQ